MTTLPTNGNTLPPKIEQQTSEVTKLGIHIQRSLSSKKSVVSFTSTDEVREGEEELSMMLVMASEGHKWDMAGTNAMDKMDEVLLVQAIDMLLRLASPK